MTKIHIYYEDSSDFVTRINGTKDEVIAHYRQNNYFASMGDAKVRSLFFYGDLIRHDFGQEKTALH